MRRVLKFHPIVKRSRADASYTAWMFGKYTIAELGALLSDPSRVEILTHLLRSATADTVRQHFRGIDFALLVEALDGGRLVTTGEQVTARDFLTGLPSLPPVEDSESDLYDQVCDRLGATSDGERASAIELALEGLYLARKVSKDSDGGETVYG